ncbi:MAG: sigma-70 family RNA polymerase sigma factor [Verrucomicrobiota bacterium]
MPDSDNSEELFVQLFAKHERQLRGFVRGMGLGWTEVDDVVQTVSLVMWRKWETFDPDSDFMKWGRVIARFEVLKFRRTMARDRHVFSDELMEQLANHSIELEEESNSHRYHEALDSCLTSLPQKSRELLRLAYHGDQTIGQVAEKIGKSATAFYKILRRIREKLQVCIEGKLEQAA